MEKYLPVTENQRTLNYDGRDGVKPFYKLFVYRKETKTHEETQLFISTFTFWMYSYDCCNTNHIHSCYN